MHTFQITLFTDAIDTATVANPSPPNLKIEYQDTVLLRGPDGTPCTGLDADAVGYFKYPGFPDLPVATYPGDGFGGAGPGGRRISIDAEGLVLAEDSNFWISDEYGPYIYKFDHSGLMTRAIRAPNALQPLRNGTISYSANSPPRYDPKRVIVPAAPTSGRNNNQGFEGLTWSPDGVNLYALLQSAATQEGGAKSSTRQYTRLVQYQIATGIGKKNQLPTPVQVAEYVVPLPKFTNAAGESRVAAQSELHFISNTQFFFLPRDSSVGRGTSDPTSVYRHIDIFDISAATNISGTYDAYNSSIASSAGVLKAGIVPATVCQFIDFNINSQLNRFGVHNGGAQDAGLLNEKWESIALATVSGGRPTGADYNDEYYVFSFSDNDFITQDGKLASRISGICQIVATNFDPRLLWWWKVPVLRLVWLQPRQPGPCLQGHTAFYLYASDPLVVILQVIRNKKQLIVM